MTTPSNLLSVFASAKRGAVALASLALSVPLFGQIGYNNSEMVQLQQLNVTGTTDQGYRTTALRDVGPWGSKNLLDTPYMVDAVSSDYIQNRIISSTDQLFADNPLVQLNLPQSRGYGSIVYVRGIRLGNGFTELNNIRVSGDLIMPVEDKQSAEVFAGLTGFLYGPGNAGGLINYDSKRPTAKPLGDLTFGNYGGSQYFGQLDVSGPIGKNLSYRINYVRSSGETAVAYDKINKWLLSGAVDYRVSSSLLLQFDYSHQSYHEDGTLADWGSFNGAIPHFSPSLIDPEKNYSQPWAYNHNTFDVASAKAIFTISDSIKIRAAYQFAEIRDENVYTGNNILYANGVYSYNLIALHNAPKQHLNQGGYVFADFDFDLFGMKNKLTAGYYTDYYKLDTHRDATQFISLGVLNFTGMPQYVSQPAFTNGALPTYSAQTVRDQNFVVGDQIAITNHLIALLGVNRTEINQLNRNASDVISSHYDEIKTTPSGSLVFKVTKAISVYGTYMESLENSGTAASTFNNQPVTNASQAIAPSRSHQYEIGAKANVNKLLLTAAAYQVDKANTYYAPNASNTAFTFTSDGEQRTRGIELTASGKLTRELTLLGGVDWLDAKVTKTNTTYLLNQPPYGAAKSLAKIYAEYAVPGYAGFSLTGGVDYVGRQVANAFSASSTAREWLGSYATISLGARYATKMADTQLIFRVDVTNLTNRSYWQQSEIIGAPRSIAFSVTGRF